MVKKSFMLKNLDGEFTHDCVKYLKQKLEWSKKKTQLDRDAYKYQDDLHKIFCDGCDQCKEYKVNNIPLLESTDVEEAIIGSLMHGLANLSVLGKLLGKSIVSDEL